MNRSPASPGSPGSLRRCFELVVVGCCLGTASGEVDADDLFKRLEEMERRQAEYDRMLAERDARIDQLEADLRSIREEPLAHGGPARHAAPSPALPPPAVPSALPSRTAVVPGPPAPAPGAVNEPDFFGNLRPNLGGFEVADTSFGDLSLSFYTYGRYLYQGALDKTYTDAFGRTRTLDLRNDIQFQKAILYWKGWFLNPNLRYLGYVWSSNTSQGQGAQVVVAGNMTYSFNEHVTAGVGIGALPTTRSVEGAWPRLLKVDSRTIADDFFRGSYTTGVWLNGKVTDELSYKVMLGNNLSQLGVDATQLDNTLDTISGSLVWMPTTGEFGPLGAFGDFEHHEDLATRFGLHFTHSTEDRQSQPNVEDPENTQIRLSDGTGLFDRNAFGTGASVIQADYNMMSIDAGLKYRGFALEGEYYFRWIRDLKAVGGPLPVDNLFDHGFQLQASYMVLPKCLQVYTAGSMIFGEYGDPWDLSLGLNWFPFQREGFERQFRVNAELIYLKNSPTGNNTVPYIVGGNGPLFVVSTELFF